MIEKIYPLHYILVINVPHLTPEYVLLVMGIVVLIINAWVLQYSVNVVVQLIANLGRIATMDDAFQHFNWVINAMHMRRVADKEYASIQINHLCLEFVLPFSL